MSNDNNTSPKPDGSKLEKTTNFLYLRSNTLCNDFTECEIKNRLIYASAAFKCFKQILM